MAKLCAMSYIDSKICALSITKYKDLELIGTDQHEVEF